VQGKEGERYLLLGNEAVVRGGLEGAFSVFTSYPGTPASEILDVASKISKEAEIYAEYSINEKVAIDTAVGAAMNGLRSVTAMKHVGLNVASDTLMVLPYFPPKTAMVVVVSDDPAAYSSQNEQDSRNYGYFANIPTLQPSSPQEAKDSMVLAAEFSEGYELPVLLRLDLRISHVRGPVTFGRRSQLRERKWFVKERGRYAAIPPYSLEAHEVLIKKMERLKAEINSGRFHALIDNGSEYGVLCAGSAASYVLDAQLQNSERPDIMKLLMVHPLPEEAVLKFLSSHKKVLVVEELDPLLETKVKSLAYERGLETIILGKESGIPPVGELSLGLVKDALARLVGAQKPDGLRDRKVSGTISRLPVFCAGCPHRASMHIIKTVAGRSRIVVSDIGCYGIGILPPTEVGDLLMDMGFSVGGANGFSIQAKEKPIAVIGDSTFFHAGIPALINAVWNGHAITLVILDNGTTAMTGLQPNPGSDLLPRSEDAQKISLEEIVRACGVKDIRVLNPFEIRTAREALKQTLAAPGVSVVIFREACALLSSKEAKAAGQGIKPYVVIADKCNNCNACLLLAGCPALMPHEFGSDEAQGKVSIDQETCTGCGFCAEVCPYDAIVVGS